MALSLGTMMRIGFRLIQYRGEIEALLPQVNKAVETTFELVPQVRALLQKIAPEFFAPATRQQAEPTFDVRWLQTSLQQRGFDPGPIDGRFGPRTVEAVKQFQAANGLVVDGMPGVATEAALFAAQRA